MYVITIFFLLLLICLLLWKVGRVSAKNWKGRGKMIFLPYKGKLALGSIWIPGQGLCVNAPQTGCASESVEGFSSLFMFKSDLRATEFESLGGAQEVSKCSQNDSGP